MGAHMKKILLLCVLLITLFLSSCENKVKTEIPLETYTLSAESFESFYQIQTRVIPNDDDTTFKITLSPKHVFNLVNASVHIRVYYDFMFESMLVNGVFEELITLDGGIQIIDKTIDYGNSYALLGYVVFEASGNITTENIISIFNKTYVEPFDKEIAFTHQIELYLELLDRIDALEIDQKSHITKTTTSTTTFIIGHDSESMTEILTEQIILDPFYYRMYSSEYELIVKNQNDYIDMFSWFGLMNQNQRLVYLDRMGFDDFDPDDYANVDDVVISSDIDFTKVAISKAGNHYFIEGFLIDLISFEEYQEIKKLYQSLGVSIDVLNSIRIQFTFKFEIDFHVISSFAILLEDLDLTIRMISVETYNFSVFQPVDPLSNPFYQLIHPDSIDRVISDTDYLSVVSSGGIGESHFYRGYLEKGVYEMNQFGGLFDFHLYDEDGNYVMHAIPDAHFSSKLFEIEQDGYYYMSIHRLSYLMPDYQFQLSKTNLVDFISPKIDLNAPGIKAFNVESNRDLVRLEYYSNQREVLKITIESDQFLLLHYPYYHGQFMISSSKTTTIGVEPGVYQFYISSNLSASGTISVEIVELPEIYSMSSTVFEVTENFFDEIIFYGGLLGAAHFTLNVVESGVYRFEMWFTSITIYERIGSNFYSIRSLSGMQPIYLEAGQYYIKTDSAFLSQGNIKYHKEPLSYQNTTIDLKRYNYHLNVMNDLEKHQSTLLHINHTHTYTFTLENDEMILFYGINTYLKNENGEILNLHRSDPNFGYHNRDIYFLKAGTYTIVQTNFIAGEKTWEIKIGIIDHLPDDDNPNHMPLEMIDGGAVTLTKNHAYDHELIKIVITEPGLYRFTSSRQFELYQDNDYIASYKDIDIQMQVGTYYVFIDTYTLGQFLTLIFGYTKIG
jgi:hypothetical protein